MNPRSSISVKNLSIPINSELSFSSDEDMDNIDNDDMLEYKKIKESIFGSKKPEPGKDDPSLRSVIVVGVAGGGKKEDAKRDDGGRKEGVLRKDDGGRRREDGGRRREEEEDISGEEEEGRYYYYKRWLWMIFPWACLSSDLKCTYSDQILKCFSSATRYMGVLQEEKYTQRALSIALEAKLKKKMIYGKQEEINEEMKTLNRMKAEINKEDSDPQIPVLKASLSGISIPKKGGSFLPPLGETKTLEDRKKFSSGKGKTEQDLRKSLEGGERFSSNKRGVYEGEGERGEEGKIFGLGKGGVQKGEEGEEEGRLFLTQGLETNLLMKSSTMKVIEKSKLLKSKYSVFRVDGIDVRREEGGREEEVGRRKGGKGGSLLPDLKQKINRHNEEALRVMEQEVEEFKKQFNFVKSENRRLEKILVEIRTKEPTLSKPFLNFRFLPPSFFLPPPFSLLSPPSSLLPPPSLILSFFLPSFLRSFLLSPPFKLEISRQNLFHFPPTLSLHLGGKALLYQLQNLLFRSQLLLHSAPKGPLRSDSSHL